MSYTQTIECPICHSPIKLNLIILEDGSPRAIPIGNHQHEASVRQLSEMGIELGIVIEDK